MALNLNDFIFHSDYTYNGLIDTYKDVVNSTAVSLAAGANIIAYGATRNIGDARSTSVATWIVPTLPQSNGGVASGNLAPGAIRKGSFAVSTTQPTGQQPMGIWFFPYVEQNGSTVRAALKMFNNTDGALTVPAAVWNMKISTYVVPPNTV